MDSVLWNGWTFCYQLPGKSSSPSIEQRLLMGGVSLAKSSSANICQALLDSGAEGNFINAALQLNIPVVKLPHPISVHALSGQIFAISHP